ncbi:MAG: dioxygenase, partial [Sciscionella sp.]
CAQANPVTDAQALEAIRQLAAALPTVVADPSDRAARAGLLRGAWLAGSCLGSAQMGLHHQLCHLLGGAFALPHSATHTVLLPHTMAYNASAVPAVMVRIAEALGVDDAPSGVFDLITRLGGPTSLEGLGVAERDLAAAVNAALAEPYPNPAALTPGGIEDLLRDAWRGCRPRTATEAAGVPDLGPLTAEVVASFARAPVGRAKALITDLIRHLHQFATSNDLTQQEWQYGIDFLTEVGAIATPTRQEFVLLSDTLGLSSVVDVLTNSRTPETTSSAVLGPFFVSGAPEVAEGSDIADALDGVPLWARLRVTDTAGRPVEGALVDVWQANEDGYYDVQLPDQDGPVLRGRLRTDADGRFSFVSILPAEYPIPDDGPVGAMLEAMGRHPYRAPHVHFMITKSGYQQLITQLFVKGGAYLDSDTVFGVKPDLVVDFVAHGDSAPDGRGVPRGWRSLEFTFVITELAARVAG